MKRHELRHEELASLLGVSPSDDHASGWNIVDTLGHLGTEARRGAASPHELQRENASAFALSVDVRFMLQSLCEEFAERWQAILQDKWGITTAIRCQQIQMDTFAVHVLTTSAPTCYCVASTSPGDGKLLIDLPLPLAWLLLGRVLGAPPDLSGPGDTFADRRWLTDMELRIIKHVLNAMLGTWCEVWLTVVPFHAMLERMESNPRVIRTLPATETLLAATYDWACDDFQSQFRVAFPARPASLACEHALRCSTSLPGSAATMTPHDWNKLG